MPTGSKKNKPKKKINTDLQPEIDKPMFCTECNSDLDAFWLDPLADKPENVRRIHENCVRIGRFNGVRCSKLFIINESDIDGLFTPEE